MFRFRIFLCLTCLVCLTRLASADDFTWELNSPSSNWNAPANWAGTVNQYPDDNTDSALITVPSTLTEPRLNASNITVGALEITSNGDLNTGNGTDNFALTVQSSNFQDGSTSILDTGSSLTVWQSPVLNDFDTDDLTITDGSLILRQGSKVQVDGQLTLNSSFTGDGEIFGSGVLEINSDQNFANDGIIRAAFGGTLTLQRTGSARIDMDGGFHQSELVADDSSQLIIDIPNVAFSDAFDDIVRIGKDGEIRINDNWDMAGFAFFNGGSGTATQSGNATTYTGTLNVNSGTAVLAAASTTIANFAAVNIADGSTLQIDSPTDILGPESLAMGLDSTLVINEDVNVGEGAGFFNWDGDGSGIGYTSTIVNSGARLNIDVARVDSESALEERFDGTLTLNGGDVDVQNADGQWEMAGALNLDSGRIFGAEVLLTGSTSVSGGNAFLHAPSVFGGPSSVQVNSGATLAIEGTHSVLNGGTWTGEGTVNLGASLVTVASSTTVDMPGGVFDLDGNVSDDLVSIEAPFVLNVAAVDESPGQWLDESFEINPSGRLVVNFDDPNRDYRFVGSLELNALSGNLASLHLSGADVGLDGTINVTGNSITDARVDIFGTMNLPANATFNLRGGSAAEPNVVHAGATFAGIGDLVVLATGYLALADEANVGVDLINLGHLEVGNSIGVATVSSLNLEPGSTYAMEIDGLAAGTEYDVLNVGAFATLDGALEILVNENGGSYAAPDVQGTIDQFVILTAGATMGSFDEFTYDGDQLSLAFAGGGQDRFHIDEGLFRILQYEQTQTSLLNYKALGGDANGDGTVDGQDFLIWNTNKFTSGTDWTTGDFNGDGTTDGQDFLIWNTNKFTSVSFAAAVPEPNTGILLTLTVVIACLIEPRR